VIVLSTNFQELKTLLEESATAAVTAGATATTTSDAGAGAGAAGTGSTAGGTSVTSDVLLLLGKYSLNREPTSKIV